MNVNLKIWRQKSGSSNGALKTYRLENIDPNISFLEMLDILNAFRPYMKQGISVVGLEPSCILSFRDEIPNLIKTEFYLLN